MDEIDRGCEREEFDRGVAQRFRREAGPKPSGECAVCGESVSRGAQFCGSECREDWEREQRRAKCL